MTIKSDTGQYSQFLWRFIKEISQVLKRVKPALPPSDLPGCALVAFFRCFSFDSSLAACTLYILMMQFQQLWRNFKIHSGAKFSIRISILLSHVWAAGHLQENGKLSWHSLRNILVTKQYQLIQCMWANGPLCQLTTPPRQSTPVCGNKTTLWVFRCHPLSLFFLFQLTPPGLLQKCRGPLGNCIHAAQRAPQWPPSG